MADPIDKTQDPNPTPTPPQDTPISPDEFKKLQASKSELETTLNSLKSKLEALETEKLKSAENKDDYIKSLESKLNEEKSLRETKEKQFMMSKVLGKAREEAIKDGLNPKYADDFQKMYSDKFKDIKVNPTTLEIEGDSLKHLISTVKEKSPYFFEKGAPKVDDLNHNKVKTDNFLEELKACKSQKELDAVRKKYGRA